MNDFFMPATPLERDLNDLISWSMELMMSPYLICLRDCLMTSTMQGLGCLQKGVLAFMVLIIKILFKVRKWGLRIL